MVKQTDGKTLAQKLSDLTEWYLSDNEVELRFTPNLKHTGKHAPEFDFKYYINSRPIGERTLAMMISCELARRNYSYSLLACISSLTEFAWRHYVATCEYPEWLRYQKPIEPRRSVGRPRASYAIEEHERRPVGRPRKHPKIDDLLPKLLQSAEVLNTETPERDI